MFELSVGVSIAKGSLPAPVTESPQAALYVTVRPEATKFPVGAKRIDARDLLGFPAEVLLGQGDLYPEFQEASADVCSGPLVISARLDGDGDANTRGEDDLVGRGSAPGCGSKGNVELQGRGAFGKFVTRKR